VASRETSRTTVGGDKSVPVNMLAVNIPVAYRVKDVRAWLCNHSEGEELLEDLANREVVRYLISVDMDDLMTVGRLKAAQELRENIQKRADQYQLGVEVVFVSMESIHPPIKVAKDYEEVVGAQQRKATNILAALAYKAGKIPAAIAEATSIVGASENEARAKVSVAAAEAGQFANQMAAWNASPQVFRQRTYLEALVRSIGKARKYVVTSSNTQETLWLNLEDKVRSDMEDLSPKEKQ